LPFAIAEIAANFAILPVRFSTDIKRTTDKDDDDDNDDIPTCTLQLKTAN